MKRIDTIIIAISLFLLGESHAWAQQKNSSITVSHGSSQANYIAANGSSNAVVQPLSISVETGGDASGIDLSYSHSSSDFVKLTVQPGGYDNMSMRVYTVKGQMILNQALTFGQSTITLPDYSNPLYMLRIYSNGKEVKSFKIIKNK